MTEPAHFFAAILFSDIEGYTTMMQQNEANAIAAVNRYQEQMEHAVAQFNGQVKQYYGDGSLCLFESAVDAISCAECIQKELMSSIPLRMGIHFGKVVLHDGRVYGDTVNIASRIESLGEPGAILFSEQVLSELPTQTEFATVAMGSYKFKNVRKEMEVFALANEGLHVPKPGSLKGKLDRPRSYKLLLVLLGVLAVVVLSFLLDQIRTRSDTSESYDSLSDTPAIAVLPFANLTSDSTQEYLADGVAEEIMILLSQDPQLQVTSRSSSFSFKGKSLDIPSIADQLQVGYILEGSVQRAGDSVRIGVQLINALEDYQIWAHSWQSDLVEIFEVQQQIADSVKNELEVQILRTSPLQQTDSEAYNLYLQARHIAQQGNVDGLQNAENLLKNTLEIDSLYGPAWSYLSSIWNRQSNIGILPTDEGHEMARKAAFKALEIDSTLSSAWAELASIAIYYDRNFLMADYYIEQAAGKILET